LPRERTSEGPFGEFTGYSLGARPREVVKVQAITHRKGALFQDISVAHLDHLLLSTIPMEANLYRAVRAMVPSLKAVRVPAPFTCYVSIEQRLPGQAKNAILAVLGADLYIKRVVVVDHDVDVFDDRQMTWAIATRCQPDRDITIVSHARGSDLDPSTRQDGLTAKWGRRRDRQAVARGLHAAPSRAGGGSGADQARGLPALTGAFFAELLATAGRHAGRPALVSDGGVLTYGELFARSGELARSLRAAGLEPGERVALLIANRPEFVVAMLAGLELGATVAPLDVLLKPDERAVVVEHLKPALLIDEAGIGAAPAGFARAAAAIVLYTSGSTGVPKGALLSHAALLFANRSWAGPVMGLCPDDAVLAVLPLAHSFGLNAGLFAPLLTGARVVLLERFVPERVAELLGRR
jgi:hypothetical protein